MSSTTKRKKRHTLFFFRIYDFNTYKRNILFSAFCCCPIHKNVVFQTSPCRCHCPLQQVTVVSGDCFGIVSASRHKQGGAKCDNDFFVCHKQSTIYNNYLIGLYFIGTIEVSIYITSSLIFPQLNLS